MRLGAELLLWATALLGHMVLWVALVNRLNGFGFRHALIHRLNRVLLLLAAVIPIAVFADQSRRGWEFAETLRQFNYAGSWLPSDFYLLLCWLTSVWLVMNLIVRSLRRSSPTQLLGHSTTVIDLKSHSDAALTNKTRDRLLLQFPGNQIYQLNVDEIELSLPRLPKALDGLSICHLSDFHMAGHISRGFHEEVVAQANRLNADLTLITGDILENPECFSWLPTTMGKLTSRGGQFFILGNHELRLRDIGEARRRLQQLGLTNLGGTTWQMEFGGSHILLAGNESPWLTSPPEISPRDDKCSQLRILLSHSPDQISWARQNQFDLMLAGHTHGGQFCLPGLGPVVCPSCYGVRYAAGVYFREPTLLHVSRGISGMIPLRLFCAPQITKLVLRHRN